MDDLLLKFYTFLNTHTIVCVGLIEYVKTQWGIKHMACKRWSNIHAHMDWKAWFRHWRCFSDTNEYSILLYVQYVILLFRVDNNGLIASINSPGLGFMFLPSFCHSSAIYVPRVQAHLFLSIMHIKLKVLIWTGTQWNRVYERYSKHWSSSSKESDTVEIGSLGHLF